MNHYYTNNKELRSDKKLIEVYIADEKYNFYTDNGVFSKGSLDFGTKTMLESFNSEKDIANVCDLGCGYGVVATYLALKNIKYKFTLIDVNERAIELSKENLELNKVTNDKEVILNDALDNITKKFDIILTNPPIRAGKKTVHKIVEQSFSSLNSSGELWVVIQKKQGMESLKKLIFTLFGNVEIITKNKGYYVLKSIK